MGEEQYVLFTEADKPSLNGVWQRPEHEAIESPSRLRRKVSYEEAEKIKRLVAGLRYAEAWDDSMFFTLAQAAQHEAKKMRKKPMKGPRGQV